MGKVSTPWRSHTEQARPTSRSVCRGGNVYCEKEMCIYFEKEMCILKRKCPYQIEHLRTLHLVAMYGHAFQHLGPFLFLNRNVCLKTNVCFKNKCVVLKTNVCLVVPSSPS